MFTKKRKREMTFLLWCGEKLLDGGTLTPEEMEEFVRCREESIKLSKLMFGIKDEDFAYTPGQPFQGN